MALGTGDGSTSICVQSKYAPIHYHWFGVTANAKVMDDVRSIVATMPIPQLTKDLLLGEFAARLVALLTGTLKPRVHVKGPLESVTHLEVFEIRASVQTGVAGEAELRAYHVEPKDLKRVGGSTIVGLHAHKKVVKRVGTYRAQNAEIAKAVKRHKAGATGRWGGARIHATDDSV